jgi:hypothetical protein
MNCPLKLKECSKTCPFIKQGLCDWPHDIRYNAKIESIGGKNEKN